MARKTTTGPTARQQARQRRAELEKARAALVARIEDEQIAFIEADEKITRLTVELDDLHATRRDAVGRLVDDERQTVSDVAVLLGISETDVKTLRKDYRTARKTTSADSTPADQPAPEQSQQDPGAGEGDAA